MYLTLLISDCLKRAVYRGFRLLLSCSLVFGLSSCTDELFVIKGAELKKDQLKKLVGHYHLLLPKGIITKGGFVTLEIGSEIKTTQYGNNQNCDALPIDFRTNEYRVTGVACFSRLYDSDLIVMAVPGKHFQYYDEFGELKSNPDEKTNPFAIIQLTGNDMRIWQWDGSSAFIKRHLEGPAWGAYRLNDVKSFFKKHWQSFIAEQTSFEFSLSEPTVAKTIKSQFEAELAQRKLTSNAKKEEEKLNQLKQELAELKNQNAPQQPGASQKPMHQTESKAISGAFGVLLGSEKYDKRETVLEWTFTPSAQEKSPYFSDYRFYTTPLSDHVMGIAGLSEPLSAETCQARAKEVFTLLEAKYGKGRENPPSTPLFMNSRQRKEIETSFFTFFRRIENDFRIVELVCVSDLSEIKNQEWASAHQCASSKTPYKGDALVNESMILHDDAVYSFRHLIRNKGGLTNGANVYPYRIGNNIYYPMPGYYYWNDQLKRCAAGAATIVRLLIRYGDLHLENSAQIEWQEAERRRTLNSDKAKGL